MTVYDDILDLVKDQGGAEAYDALVELLDALKPVVGDMEAENPVDGPWLYVNPAVLAKDAIRLIDAYRQLTKETP